MDLLSGIVDCGWTPSTAAAAHLLQTDGCLLPIGAVDKSMRLDHSANRHDGEGLKIGFESCYLAAFGRTVPLLRLTGHLEQVQPACEHGVDYPRNDLWQPVLPPFEMGT
jgi:hypothetical protein